MTTSPTYARYGRYARYASYPHEVPALVTDPAAPRDAWLAAVRATDENYHVAHWLSPRDVIGFVADGARALDAHDPNWFRRVNLATLDVSNPAYCVLGQLYGDYLHKSYELDLRYGTEFPGVYRAFDAAAPTVLWVAEVEARRVAEASLTASLA